MANFVYTVTFDVEYEFGECIGVFTTHDKAVNFVEKCLEKGYGYIDRSCKYRRGDHDKWIRGDKSIFIEKMELDKLI